MSQLAITSNATASRKRWVRWTALAAVVLVPLAFAGLFVGALSKSDDALQAIPAAIVNDDTLVYQTAADGTESPVFAGRLLVTELTDTDESTGFDWRITNAEDAQKALDNGEVYAVLTVPSNFSKSILSISGDDPEQADITIDTDDSHSYLTGSVAQVVGESMVSTFGNAITAQYIEGIYSSLGGVGEAFQTASDGATEIADGATKLADGTDKLADGTDKLADGTDEFADGIGAYSDGVDQYTAGVDSLAGGLGKLNTGAKQLTQLSDGVADYTRGVSQTSSGLIQLNAAIQANPTVDPAVKAGLQQTTDGLAQLSTAGTTLRSATATGVSGIQGGISKSSGGANKIAAGSPALRSGAAKLEAGASKIADSTHTIADNTHTIADNTYKLADGITELADGLATGAESIPAMDEDAAKASAEIAADPVGLTVTTANKVSEVGQGIATYFVPLGLWLGALAIFLVLAPVSRRALTSTANSGRLVLSTLSRAGIVAAAQALLLVLLLHIVVKVDWALLPATIAFSLLMAAAFTAFHYLLTIGLGRAGLVVSLFLLAVQMTSTGSIYPIELLAAPFQAISPFLPLTYGVAGMQGILSGGNVASLVTSIVVLVLIAVGSVLISLLAIRRTRRAVSLGLVPASA